MIASERSSYIRILTVLVASLLVVGCGRSVAAPDASALPLVAEERLDHGSSPSLSPTPTPRPTTAATRDCTVSWARSYGSIALLTNDAHVIVRASALRQDTVALRPGLGAAPTREARRTVLRVTSVLKATSPVPGQIAVVEDVCPNLTVSPGEEWILFLRPVDQQTDPATTGDLWTLGGPQGQFRIVGGRIVGPFFTFARAVHSYEGATIDELLADIAAAPSLDPQAGVRFVEARGWSVLRPAPFHDFVLPSNADFVFSVADAVKASTDVGLTLGPYIDQPLVIAPVDLVDVSGRGLEPRAWIALSGGRIVGAWGYAWRSDAPCGVFSLRSPRAVGTIACP